MLYFIINDSLHYKYAFGNINDKEKVVPVKRTCRKLAAMSNRYSVYKKMLFKLISMFLFRGRLICQDIVCFTDGAFRILPKGFVSWLREKYNIKTVLLLYNKVSLIYGLDGNVQMQVLEKRDEYLPFDLIYSYDLDDVRQLGFKYAEIYSRMEEYNLKDNNNVNFDVYYCGSVSKSWKLTRYEYIDSTYRHLTQAGVKCDFHLVCENGVLVNECDFLDRKRIPYNDVIDQIIDSNCILEIVSDGKYGATFRYFEALAYNKKLLTNNYRITELPFYNEKYMRIFSDPSEIDIDWCKAKENVDYGYNDDFSPANFYHTVIRDLDAHDRQICVST